jgi:DNA-binding GntR family transcriptional regulator
MKRTSEPLSTQLYHELRRRIIVGTYPQGVRLPEQRIAEDLKVSRIPLREALPQLEVEGFVQSSPRRGVVVRQWTTKSVHELFDVRLAIEPQAAHLAARRADGGDSMKELKDSLAASEAELHTDDPLRVSIANAKFHQDLVNCADNELLSGLMNAVAGRMTWLFYLTARRDPIVACAEHRAITEAVSEGNDELAKALMFAHIEAGRRPSFDSMELLLNDSPGS